MERVCSDESDGEGSGRLNRLRDLYSLKKMNHFLNETFGQFVKVDNSFAATEKFIRLITIVQKMVSFARRKWYRLRKHVTISKSNKTRKCKKKLINNL